MKRELEALLFATDGPLTPARLKKIFPEAGAAELKSVVQELVADYEATGNAFTVVEFGGGWQIATRPDYAPLVERLFSTRRFARLSRAGLEVLAIIAYRQPLTRLEIEEIRGVNSSGAISTLQERNLINVVGRSEAVGHPLLYGTTREFLNHLGLAGIGQLPSLPDLESMIQDRDELKAFASQFGAELTDEDLEELRDPEAVEVTGPAAENEDDSQAVAIDQASGDAGDPADADPREESVDDREADPPRDADDTLRLNRFLARAGYGSRRGVETLVNERRVAINGEIVTDLARRVDPERDEVRVDGLPVESPQDFRIYAFHKPVGVVSTLRGQGGQQSLTGFALRASIPGRFKPVGRLDADSGGLLLWTDDGDLAQALLKPRSEVWKRYEVTLAKMLAPGAEKMLVAGKIVLDGYPVRPCKIQPDPDGDRRLWTMELHEGRKRQIRRMMAAVGGKVVTLTRTAIGPVELGRLHEGDFRRLGRPEEEALRRAAGLDHR